MSKVCKLEIRCSEEYKASVMTAAKDKDMSVSEYVCFCIDNVGLYMNPKLAMAQEDEVVHLISRMDNDAADKPTLKLVKQGQPTYEHYCSFCNLGVPHKCVNGGIKGRK